ncbi:MAG: DUF971 domain-containing protein [Ignavibacteriales bacterium]|nr:DUF971 domain-containing protein [Ignavibacteriales bacterium]
MTPIKIKQRSETHLSIVWNDNHQSMYLFHTLRDSCPCASCKADIEIQNGKILLPILVPGKYVLKSIEPVGSYALQCTWGDEHRTGIYTYELLRSLCECSDCKEKK